jgi:hypothetical protein
MPRVGDRAGSQVHINFARFCWAAPPALPAGAFAPLSAPKEAAPAAQAVKKFLLRSMYNVQQVEKQILNSLRLLIKSL